MSHIELDIGGLHREGTNYITIFGRLNIAYHGCANYEHEIQ